MTLSVTQQPVPRDCRSPLRRQLRVIFGLDDAPPPTAGLPLKAECRPERAETHGPMHAGTSRTLLGRLERSAPVDHYTRAPLGR